MAEPEQETIDRVAWAINEAWNKFGDVPFPLYQSEAEELAKAAIAALSEMERENQAVIERIFNGSQPTS